MTQNTQSDESIKKLAEDALKDCPYVDPCDVEVTCEYGFIDLNGTVRDRMQREAAEKVVKAIPEVKDVFNYITIDRKNGLIGNTNDDVHMI